MQKTNKKRYVAYGKTKSGSSVKRYGPLNFIAGAAVANLVPKGSKITVKERKTGKVTSRGFASDVGRGKFYEAVHKQETNKK